VNTAYSVLGVVLIVIGAAAIGLGVWITITARRPPWLSRRTAIPVGRERGWGASLVVTGSGGVALGASDLQGLAFSALRIFGIVGLLAGVVLLLVVVRPRPSQ
jgi:hypothetical protein